MFRNIGYTRIFLLTFINFLVCYLENIYLITQILEVISLLTLM
jgi:hypothetical protein